MVVDRGMSRALYPWQRSDWQALRQLGDKLPHALLLHGPPGIGKLEFATFVAQALLCETPQAEGEPCGRCEACHWFIHGNHPDFRRVRPEAVALAEGEAVDEEGGEEGRGAETGADEGSKKGRQPSREIRIEQVRGVLDFVNIGTHRAGRRVILLYPLETLNVHAANALLKTLEEPPTDTVFLLLADRIYGILPTILSRCRKFALRAPVREAALTWLREQGVSDAETALAEHSGTPLTVLRARDAEDAGLRQWFLEQLTLGERIDPFAVGEHLQKAPVALILGWVQRWCHDLLGLSLSGHVRYFPQHRKALEACARRIAPLELTRFTRSLIDRRRFEQHPLVARLVFESLLLEYRSLFIRTASQMAN